MTEKQRLETATALVKAHGWGSVKFYGICNGFMIYQALSKDSSGDLLAGLPVFVTFINDTPRFLSAKENFAVFDYFATSK